jgi:hypothetical protein
MVGIPLRAPSDIANRVNITGMKLWVQDFLKDIDPKSNAGDYQQNAPGAAQSL